jgi:hypothetical protein
MARGKQRSRSQTRHKVQTREREACKLARRIFYFSFKHCKSAEREKWNEEESVIVKLYIAKMYNTCKPHFLQRRSFLHIYSI